MSPAAERVGRGWGPGAVVAWVAGLGDRAELWDGTVWSPGPELAWSPGQAVPL